MKKTEIASLKLYRKVFRSYKLRFYKPKKDLCPKCLAWKHKAPGSRTPEGADKMSVHLKQKQLSYKLKDADTKFVQSADNRIELCVITRDLQKTMSTPKGENGEFYYKSKFTTYNFTVFVSGEQQGYCYTWDQTTGKKGCTEVTSCMWSFIKMQAVKGIKEIRIYSDNCAAQNKNQYLFAMYVMASIRYNIKIVHRYLESGHTLLQCDSMHARIENSMKNEDVFSPSQWVTAMKMAKVNNPKYIVKVMEQEELYDFTPLASFQSWDKIKTSQIREEELTLTETQIMKPKRGRPVNWSTFPLKRTYQTKFPVRPDILKGLQDLCKSGAIPAEHAPFYMEHLPSLNLIQQEGDAPNSDVSDVGSDAEIESSDSEGSDVE
ncbi:hypothetical protein KUF71_002851 [Frankliniella fusca]|uniref:DUF7869 domain-containing protein n=1 Tax=Frankliniella fusca TaxID=407009 RepID=A0AAE1HYS3_9NEOP|nr:hypothetical protein KUF71_002851 [Frankliniella fusca]